MAKLFGTHSLRGTIGDVTYSKTGKGFTARKRTVMTKKKMDANPNFAALRDQAAEFGRALKASRLLRNTFQPIILRSGDRGLTNRLTSLMNKVIKQDRINPRGQRNVIDGELAILKEFQFNPHASLSNTLSTKPIPTIDRVTGEAKLVIPSFVPFNVLKYPQKTNYFRVCMGVASIDFEMDNIETRFVEGDYLPAGKDPVPEIVLTASLTPNGTSPIFMVVRVEFVEEVNDNLLAIPSPEFTACTLLNIDTGV